MSLGSGHVWRTITPDGAQYALLRCVGCGVEREGRTPRQSRFLRSLARDMGAKASTALGVQRPLGTCPRPPAVLF